MICSQCGKTLPDGSRFCDACGAPQAVETAPVAAPVAAVPETPAQPVYQQPAAPAQPVYPQPQQVYYAAPAPVPKAPNPMVKNFLAGLKGFFSKNVVKAVGTAAKSNTAEWLLFAAVAVFAFAIGSAVTGYEMIVGLFKSLGSSGDMLGSILSDAIGLDDLGEMFGSGMGGMVNNLMAKIADALYPFFGVFGIGLLLGAVTYFGVSLCIWVLVSAIFKKQVTLVQVFNMVGVASLPLAVVNLANMLFGLIWAPLTFLLFLGAVLMTCVLLYAGLQKLDKLETSPFYGYSVILFIMIGLTVLVGSLLYKAALESAISNMVSNLVGSMGNMMGNMF